MPPASSTRSVVTTGGSITNTGTLELAYGTYTIDSFTVAPAGGLFGTGTITHTIGNDGPACAPSICIRR